MELTWTTISTPIGDLLIVASPAGLVRVAFDNEGDALDSLAERMGEGLVEGSMPNVKRQLAEYFAGTRRTFDVALDWRLARGFRGEVQRALTGIGYGRTETYAQLAQRVGAPKAVRAVGTGCATNPLPIFAPCHRVLRSDGSLGGYRGGAEVKSFLLELETKTVSSLRVKPEV